jgi:hypothetical protein
MERRGRKMVTKGINTRGTWSPHNLHETRYIWKELDTPELIPIVIDESELNHAQISLQAKREEIAALEARKITLAGEIETVKAEYKRISVLAELGEASVDAVEENAKRLATLNQTLSELSESNSSVLSTIEIKQAAVRELQARKRAALFAERERVFAEKSDECRTSLKKLLTEARKVTELAVRVGMQFRELSASGLADSGVNSVPDFESIVDIHFRGPESKLYSDGESGVGTPVNTQRERAKEREAQTKVRQAEAYAKERAEAYAGQKAENHMKQRRGERLTNVETEKEAEAQRIAQQSELHAEKLAKEFAEAYV